MATTPTSREHHTAPPDLDTILASLRRHLTAQRSPGTLATHSAAVRGLDTFLADRTQRSNGWPSSGSSAA